MVTLLKNELPLSFTVCQVLRSQTHAQACCKYRTTQPLLCVSLVDWPPLSLVSHARATSSDKKNRCPSSTLKRLLVVAFRFLARRKAKWTANLNIVADACFLYFQLMRKVRRTQPKALCQLRSAHQRRSLTFEKRVSAHSKIGLEPRRRRSWSFTLCRGVSRTQTGASAA